MIVIFLFIRSIIIISWFIRVVIIVLCSMKSIIIIFWFIKSINYHFLVHEEYCHFCLFVPQEY